MAAYGVLVYSFSHRYLTLFPQERELARKKGSSDMFPWVHGFQWVAAHLIRTGVFLVAAFVVA